MNQTPYVETRATVPPALLAAPPCLPSDPCDGERCPACDERRGIDFNS